MRKHSLLIALLIAALGAIQAGAQGGPAAKTIKTLNVEGLIKVFTPENKELLVAPGESPEIPSGSRIKVLMKNADISVGDITVHAREKGIFRISVSRETGNISIAAEKDSAGPVTAALKKTQYTLDPSEIALFSTDKDATKVTVTAISGQIMTDGPRGSREISTGKKFTDELKEKKDEAQQPRPEKTAAPVKAAVIDKIVLVSRTGTITVITPDRNILTVKPQDPPPDIPLGSMIRVDSGTAKLRVGDLVLLMDKDGIIQPKYDAAAKTVELGVSKKSKSAVRAVIGTSSIVLKEGQKVTIKMGSAGVYEISSVSGNLSITTPAGARVLKEGKNLELGATPVSGEGFTPEPVQMPIEEASPSGF